MLEYFVPHGLCRKIAVATATLEREMRKTVVLSTSKIQEYSNTRGLSEPTSVFHPTPEQAAKGAASHPFFSTGILERCLEEGHDVNVVTTRTREELGAHDQWWINLVGENKVFTTPSETEHELRTSSDNLRNQLRSNRLFEPWSKLFSALGKSFPEGKYDFWLDLTRDLATYDIVWGATLSRD